MAERARGCGREASHNYNLACNSLWEWVIRPGSPWARSPFDRQSNDFRRVAQALLVRVAAPSGRITTVPRKEAVMPRSGFLAASLIGLAAMAAGCSKHTNGVGTGTVEMRITDAPAGIPAVRLAVREISVNRGTREGPEGSWEVLRADSDSSVIDLLALRNGVFAGLGMATVAAGHYSQIRLKLGPGSTVTVDGVTSPLVVSSGTQSGFKIIGDFDVPDGGGVVLLLDFDAAKSVHSTGNGTWMLQPVARLLEQTHAGAIRGEVAPAGVQTTLHAIAGAETIQTTVAAANGNFVLSVLPAGTCSVAFTAAAGYRDTTISGVAVTAGGMTDVGAVHLTAQ
jgi:hypothetical protein